MNEFRLYLYGNKAQYQRFVIRPGEGDAAVSLLDDDEAAFQRFLFQRILDRCLFVLYCEDMGRALHYPFVALFFSGKCFIPAPEENGCHARPVRWSAFAACCS